MPPEKTTALLSSDQLHRMQPAGAHVKEMLRDMEIDCRASAHEHGVDRPEVADWVWPF